MSGLPPHFLRIARQNTENSDCAVAAISTLCGVNYEEALAACVQVVPDVLTDGLTGSQIQRVMDLLHCAGEVTANTKTIDLEEHTGVLIVSKRRDWHAVILWAGRIIDGNGELWLDPHDFLRHHGYRLRGLVRRKE